MNIHESVKAKWPDIEVNEKNKIPEILVPPALLTEVAEYLLKHGQPRFDLIVSMSGVDWKDSMVVVYHLRATENDEMLVMKVRTTDREKPEIDSVVAFWRGAEFHEREIFDLFGIRFRNHPDLRRILLDDDWTGYPLRKDYTDEINIIER